VLLQLMRYIMLWTGISELMRGMHKHCNHRRATAILLKAVMTSTDTSCSMSCTSSWMAVQSGRTPLPEWITPCRKATTLRDCLVQVPSIRNCEYSRKSLTTASGDSGNQLSVSLNELQLLRVRMLKHDDFCQQADGGDQSVVVANICLKLSTISWH